MPTLSEFIMTMGLRYSEADETTLTFFRFETVREFQSFRYEVEVEAAFDTEAHAISFVIKGVRAPVGLMSATGPAVTEICYPLPVGDYTVTVAGAKQTGAFRFKRRGQEIKLLETDGEDFVQVHLVEKIEVIRA